MLLNRGYEATQLSQPFVGNYFLKRYERRTPLKKKSYVVSRRPSTASQPSQRSKERSSTARGILASIIAAIASAIIGYTVSFGDAHRKVQVDKLDKQIERLYGPLYAFSTASHQAWSDLRRVSGRGVYFFNDEDMPDAESVELWRRWMKIVFMPLNLKMEDAIVTNVQLLEGKEIYPCFIDFISHVESYKATLASWKDDDDLTQTKNRTVKANTAVIVYPQDLDQCISEQLTNSFRRRQELERFWTGIFLFEPERTAPRSCDCIRKG